MSPESYLNLGIKLVVLLTIIYSLIGFAFVSVIWICREDCPREDEGYDCKGDACDHSEKAMQEAKFNMRKH